MEEIVLKEPEAGYVEEIWALRREILASDRDSESQFAGCSGLEMADSAEEWIRKCQLQKEETACAEMGKVPSHVYLAVRSGDNRVVGIIDLRHHIDHPVLGTWGGHCGYSVRPAERGKGYAKEMLRLNLENAKRLQIPRLLVTCDGDNAASERTIMANGGVYEKTIAVDGRKVKRYWIPVSETGTNGRDKGKSGGKTGRTRNELIQKCVEYALEKLEIIEE